jgi:hypothetical protein
VQGNQEFAALWRDAQRKRSEFLRIWFLQIMNHSYKHDIVRYSGQSSKWLLSIAKLACSVRVRSNFKARARGG